MNPLWTPYGSPMDPLWTSYDPNGLPMDPPPLWIPYGSPMDLLWIPGSIGGSIDPPTCPLLAHMRAKEKARVKEMEREREGERESARDRETVRYGVLLCSLPLCDPSV